MTRKGKVNFQPCVAKTCKHEWDKWVFWNSILSFHHVCSRHSSLNSSVSCYRKYKLNGHIPHLWMPCLKIPYLLLSLQVFSLPLLVARLNSQSASSDVQWCHQLSWAVLVGCHFHHPAAVFLFVAYINNNNITTNGKIQHVHPRGVQQRGNWFSEMGQNISYLNNNQGRQNHPHNRQFAQGQVLNETPVISWRSGQKTQQGQLQKIGPTNIYLGNLFLTDDVVGAVVIDLLEFLIDSLHWKIT